MKTYVSLCLIALMFILCGCKSTPQFSKLEVGMTRAQVIEILGDPFTQKAQRGVIYFIYRDYNHPLASSNGNYNPQHFVRFIDGRVESFGDQGDFDSTKDPTFNLNIKNR